MTKYFTWSEFDKSVDYIADQCKNWKLSGIYGIPRGGLCLAVALSHKLNIKLIDGLGNKVQSSSWLLKNNNR